MIEIGDHNEGPAEGIMGRVQDEAGKPLNGVTVYLINPDSASRRRYDFRLITAPDGTFSTPVEKNVSYTLTIPSFQRKDSEDKLRWYISEQYNSIKEGADLSITLHSWLNHVGVTVMDCGLSVNECEAWLEDRNGRKVEVGHSQKRITRDHSEYGETTNIHVSFYGAPTGWLKAVIKTDSDRIFQTDFLYNEDGKSLSVDIESE